MSVLFAVAFGSFTLSLIGKWLADHFLTSRIPVLGSFAGFQYATNSGVAFSLTFPWHFQGILITLAIVLLGYSASHARTRLSRIGFGLILGGALGNVADRLFDGVVTDFVQVGTFPIFNVADSCITVGVTLLLIEGVMMWSRKEARKQRTENK